MMAMDLVQDPVQLTPDHDLRDRVIQEAFRRGLLLLGCGECALRFCPPLCITAEQVDKALEIVGGVLAGLGAEKLAV
jgi:4-aminobutyrate aminotransferase